MNVAMNVQSNECGNSRAGREFMVMDVIDVYGVSSFHVSQWMDRPPTRARLPFYGSTTTTTTVALKEI